MPICPQKGQKGAKVGGAVWENQLFCILLKIGSLVFFDNLHEVREHSGVLFDPTPFLGFFCFAEFDHVSGGPLLFYLVVNACSAH